MILGLIFTFVGCSSSLVLFHSDIICQSVCPCLGGVGWAGSGVITVLEFGVELSLVSNGSEERDVFSCLFFDQTDFSRIRWHFQQPGIQANVPSGPSVRSGAGVSTFMFTRVQDVHADGFLQACRHVSPRPGYVARVYFS